MLSPGTIAFICIHTLSTDMPHSVLLLLFLIFFSFLHLHLLSLSLSLLFFSAEGKLWKQPPLQTPCSVSGKREGRLKGKGTRCSLVKGKINWECTWSINWSYSSASFSRSGNVFTTRDCAVIQGSNRGPQNCVTQEQQTNLSSSPSSGPKNWAKIQR